MLLVRRRRRREEIVSVGDDQALGLTILEMQNCGLLKVGNESDVRGIPAWLLCCDFVP
jgi:hypothetical protein